MTSSKVQYDQNWSMTVQPYAIRKIYNKVWPNREVIELDDDWDNPLKKIFDVAGSDKALRNPDGTISFLAQRFRKYSQRKYDDFTLRYSRPSGRPTEWKKVLKALKNNNMLAAYYAYGHVDKQQTGFLRFRILHFRKFLEYWQEGKICKPLGPIPNPDNSSTFIAWPFSKIPKELILFEKITK